ncbi:hypothetical protein Voc01_085940 [Virgisporangium ochraceum]|uniref:Uncharacterized protein n=1 Tax=Virgisporangium ochraceum TaxID=65505 RepID=A0A8J4EIW5_9ACTN|nr:hypothetical protein Voc01_085940 [Virgisporangium ochraceum]
MRRTGAAGLATGGRERGSGGRRRAGGAGRICCGRTQRRCAWPRGWAWRQVGVAAVGVLAVCGGRWRAGPVACGAGGVRGRWCAGPVVCGERLSVGLTGWAGFVW